MILTLKDLHQRWEKSIIYNLDLKALTLSWDLESFFILIHSDTNGYQQIVGPYHKQVQSKK